MDPIRTAVKLALIPLRVVVELGDQYVSRGTEPEIVTPDVTDTPAPAATPKKRQPSAKRSRPRKAAARTAPSRAQAAPSPPQAAAPSPPQAAPSPPQASSEPKDLDDVALARKVETIIFRDDTVPKGHINVNAADGVVWLRGEAKTPDMIKALEHQTAEIPEVRRVENLLHLPKTPAPTRTTVGS